jgi:DNA-directed RNA polymerase specialized sigma24 family protein
MAHGLTSKEASAVLGEPAGTVRWRVSEATKQLRAFLQAVEEEDP